MCVLLCSLHLYHMFPDARLGQLASYRTLLVKNRHLATLAEKLEIRKYLLARDPVHSESEKQRDMLDKNQQPSDSATEEPSATSLDADAHMYANHLEAVLGAVYLDGGLSATQQLIVQLFFPEEVGSPSLLEQMHMVTRVQNFSSFCDFDITVWTSMSCIHRYRKVAQFRRLASLGSFTQELQKVWLDYPPHPLQVRVCLALKCLSRMRLPHNCIVIALFPGMSKKTCCSISQITLLATDI